MTNRFPLIVDSDDKQIKEIPSGDTLQLTGCDITGVTDITATGDLEIAEVTATGFIQFGSYTDAQRDALTPANGMVIYNTTDHKFQGYADGGWVNLH